MKSLALLSSVALGVTACSAADSSKDAAPGSNAPAPSVENGQIPIAIETARKIEGSAARPYAAPWPGLFPDDDLPEGQHPRRRSIPVAIRGKWRENEGTPASSTQCDGFLPDNMGKVLTIRDDSYTFFEPGGRLVSVSEREPGRIRALFNTKFGDHPSQDELEFSVDPASGTLTVHNFDTDEHFMRTYRRCPG
ncbi:hypothetical protein [Alteriqipengyuania abyssalis]|uniref:hypothetical protein n=1 Tax=Alteriqipengyuania abyssalis TaxID=2860200 RepID=UPI0020070352|nr:hypothetical protein [Alteriqipengyuania abyssalis]